jgi:methyl-accepting chemotaxis protein
MNTLRNFNIATRLVAAFVAVLALMGSGALVGVWQLGRLQQIAERLAGEEAQKLVLSERWMRGIAVNLVRARVSLLTTDEDELLARLKVEMEATSKEISEHERAIRALVSAEDGKQVLDRVSALRESYRGLRSALIKRREAGQDVREAQAREMTPAADAYLASVREFVRWQQGELEAAHAEASKAGMLGRDLVLMALGLGLAAGIAIAILISRSVVAPLRGARDCALRIAAGDLEGRMDIEGRDEAAEMLRAMAEMQANLRRIVGEVHATAGTVSTASTQIASGNADLSARTEEQASSIEETAASIEELTSTVNQNAQNARQADQLAVSASEIANRGGEVVNQVVKTMDEIQGSSKKISEIIGVIDGIAFQTNILALNAAVEAARAGDQGRGFAVVASEVRSLAQRSASAAKEIKSLITDSVSTVDAGSRLVDEAGKTMAKWCTA